MEKRDGVMQSGVVIVTLGRVGVMGVFNIRFMELDKPGGILAKPPMSGKSVMLL